MRVGSPRSALDRACVKGLRLERGVCGPQLPSWRCGHAHSLAPGCSEALPSQRAVAEAGAMIPNCRPRAVHTCELDLATAAPALRPRTWLAGGKRTVTSSAPAPPAADAADDTSTAEGCASAPAAAATSDATSACTAWPHRLTARQALGGSPAEQPCRERTGQQRRRRAPGRAPGGRPSCRCPGFRSQRAGDHWQRASPQRARPPAQWCCCCALLAYLVGQEAGRQRGRKQRAHTWLRL